MGLNKVSGAAEPVLALSRQAVIKSLLAQALESSAGGRK
jgi:hypothetical protein